MTMPVALGEVIVVLDLLGTQIDAGRFEDRRVDVEIDATAAARAGRAAQKRLHARLRKYRLAN